MQAGRISLPTYFSKQNELESREGCAGHGFSQHLYCAPFSLTVYSGFSIAPRASVEHLDPHLHCSGI